jgi:hypothetical protein
MTVPELAAPHPPTIMSCVRPSERPKLIDASAKGHLVQRPGDVRTDRRMNGIGGLRQQFTKEGPLASDARTVRTLVEHGGRWRRRATEKLSLVCFFLIPPSITLGNVRTVRTSCRDPDLMRRDHPVADRER